MVNALFNVFSINKCMRQIDEYIKLPKAERQAHLKLDESCIERGGPAKGGLSSYCKGLMAHILGTTIPSGNKIHVCHACNNSKCSNPNHLYWGTASENYLDTPRQTLWEKTVAKYGEEKAREMQVRKTAAKGGAGNLGKEKSAAHKEKIALAIKAKWAERKQN